MRLIDSGYEYIKQEPGLIGVYKQIERAARVSYKSEDRITEGSAQRMVEALIKNGHLACLEHGTIYLKCDDLGPDEYGKTSNVIPLKGNYSRNPYSRVTYHNWNQKPTELQSEFCKYIPRTTMYVTTNARVLVENNWLDDLKYICEPTEFHEKRITVKFTCSIGIGREITRHRAFSFMQESTRYCNYSKDKFGNELTFIIPQWIYDCQQYHGQFIDSLTGDSKDWILREDGERLIHSLCCEDRVVSSWVDLLGRIEEDYLYYTTEPDGFKLSPQEARGILPLDLKSELIVTGFVSDWIHFFALRSHFATTGKPHPDLQILADNLLRDFIDKKYITDEDLSHLE